jgi:hypothetical protein
MKTERNLHSPAYAPSALALSLARRWAELDRKWLGHPSPSQLHTPRRGSMPHQRRGGLKREIHHLSIGCEGNGRFSEAWVKVVVEVVEVVGESIRADHPRKIRQLPATIEEGNSMHLPFMQCITPDHRTTQQVN